MRASFIANEIGIGLRRNLVMTVAVVISTAVSLSLVGLSLMINRQVDAMKDYWYDRVEVSVYLCGATSTAPSCAAGAVTDAQRQQIRADLQALPQVARVYYESQGQAYTRFKEQFQGSAIVDSVTADQLPESYRVKLKDPQQFDIVASAFQGRPGVEEVQDQKAVLQKLFDLLNGLSFGAWVIAVAMLVVAVLLVAVTIQTSAFSRRRETGIMRLVGASKFAIQLPFLLEGVLAALLGAGLAVAATAAYQAFYVNGTLRERYPLVRTTDWADVWAVAPVLLAIGVSFAAVASFATLQRYLRV